MSELTKTAKQHYSLVRYVRKMPKIKSFCQNWFYCFFGFLRGQI